MKILVDVTYVQELERRCRFIADALEDAQFAAEGLREAPSVARALDKFHGRWTKARGEIGQGLVTVEENIRTIREVFEETDRRLMVSLEQDDEE